ncbi:hypothetical protein [Woodsholea maritima]|uniref:hypothetical protein n=1 Tax=Woodsholea maritima TaxID=240237 RepID=UPI0003705227|nr:hypothetical protein [Woodsholea maritima]
MKVDISARQPARTVCSGAYCILAGLLAWGKPSTIKPKHVRYRLPHITGADLHDVPFSYNPSTDQDAANASEQAHIFYGATGLITRAPYDQAKVSPIATTGYGMFQYNAASAEYDPHRNVPRQGHEMPSSLHALFSAFRPKARASYFVSDDFGAHLHGLGAQDLWAGERHYFNAHHIPQRHDDAWVRGEDSLALLWTLADHRKTSSPPHHWWLLHNKGLSLYDPQDGRNDHSWGERNIDPLTYDLKTQTAHGLNLNGWAGFALILCK